MFTMPKRPKSPKKTQETMARSTEAEALVDAYKSLRDLMKNTKNSYTLQFEPFGKSEMRLRLEDDVRNKGFSKDVADIFIQPRIFDEKALLAILSGGTESEEETPENSARKLMLEKFKAFSDAVQDRKDAEGIEPGVLTAADRLIDGQGRSARTLAVRLGELVDAQDRELKAMLPASDQGAGGGGGAAAMDDDEEEKDSPPGPTVF